MKFLLVVVSLKLKKSAPDLNLLRCRHYNISGNILYYKYKTNYLTFCFLTGGRPDSNSDIIKRLVLDSFDSKLRLLRLG